MQPQSLALALALGCLATFRAASAQTTWIVDAAGGAGHHFTDVPPALSAASPGDRIVVRAGSYSVATTSKGVALLGEPGAQFQLALFPSPTAGLRVVNLPAGQTFALEGFNPSVVIAVPLFEAVGCAGRIHLDRVALSRTSANGGAGLDHSTLGFMLPAPAVRSTVSDVELLGEASDVLRAGAPVRGFGTPAVSVGGGTLLIDPVLTLVPTGSSPAIAGLPTTFVNARRPSLRVRGDGLGGQIDADLFEVAGHLAALFVGVPGAPLATPWGSLWIDPEQIYSFASAVIGPTEHWSTAFPVPLDPLLFGAAIGWQSASGPAAGQGWFLAPPAVTRIHF